MRLTDKPLPALSNSSASTPSGVCRYVYAIRSAKRGEFEGGHKASDLKGDTAMSTFNSPYGRETSHLNSILSFRDYQYILFFGISAAIAGAFQLAIPGTDGGVADPREIFALLSIIFLRHWWQPGIVGILASLSGPYGDGNAVLFLGQDIGDLLVTISMHVVGISVAWILYTCAVAKLKNHFMFCLGWGGMVAFIYYIPYYGMFALTKTALYDTGKSTWQMYTTFGTSLPIELVFTAVTTIFGSLLVRLTGSYIEMINQSNAALKRSEENFRSLSANMPVTSYRCMFDDNWTMEYISEEITRITGHPADDFINNKTCSFASIIHKDDRQRVRDAVISAINDKRTFEIEYRVMTTKNTTRWVFERGQALASNENKVDCLIGMIMDITDRKELQTRLHQSEKIESIGQLAGGIAHDFNNMLAGIMGAAELLSLRLPTQDDDNRKLVDLIQGSTMRAADLTQKLLTFARKGKPVSTSIDVHPVIKDALALLEKSMEKRIEIRADLSAEKSCIIGDPSQIQNIIINLGFNARDAMPDGGILYVRTSTTVLEPNYCIASGFQITPGSFLHIEVRDTGSGMDLATQTRIFDPFFTTKEQGKGTGLGLASVYGSICTHRGAITVYSEPGSGTVFNLYLPLCDNDASSPSKPNLPPPRGSGRILVIDDEAVIRTTATMALTELGYEALMAEDGESGVTLFQAQHNNIDAVILDMIMPKMGGVDTFRSLRKIDPQVKVIMASGFAHEDQVKELLNEGLVGFIGKPFRCTELANMLSATIASTPRAHTPN